MVTTPSVGWPTERVSPSGVLATVGRKDAGMLQWALGTGDPLADAVVEELQRLGTPARICFDRGIRSGLSSLSEPTPCVTALLTQTEAIPEFADDELLDSGSLPYYSVPFPVHMVALRAGALIHIDRSPSISEVLSATKVSVDGADRRTGKIGKWLSMTMFPGELRPTRPGYVATLRARLYHAYMRRLALSRGFDESRFGVPINQVDMAHTWIHFTYTSLRAEELLGFELAPQELASVYRYWRVLAHLLGLDVRLVEGIASNEQASRLNALLQSVTGPAVDDPIALTRATLNQDDNAVSEALEISEPLGRRGIASVARLLHGDRVAGELQINSSRAADKVVATAIDRIRTQRRALRSAPDKWDAQIANRLLESRAVTRGLDW